MRAVWRAVVLVCLVAGVLGRKVIERPLTKRWRYETVKLEVHNVDDVFTKGERWLLEFYSPKCVHCQNFAKEYERVREKLSDDLIIVSKMNAANSLMMLKRFQVYAYPTFVLIDENNKVKTFVGRYSADDLVKFARRGTPGREVKDMWFGPTSSFWKLVVPLAVVTQKGLDTLRDKNFSKAVIILGAIVLSCGMVLIFFLALYISTMPPKPQKRD